MNTTATAVFTIRDSIDVLHHRSEKKTPVDILAVVLHESTRLLPGGQTLTQLTIDDGSVPDGCRAMYSVCRLNLDEIFFVGDVIRCNNVSLRVNGGTLEFRSNDATSGPAVATIGHMGEDDLVRDTFIHPTMTTVSSSLGMLSSWWRRSARRKSLLIPSNGPQLRKLSQLAMGVANHILVQVQLVEKLKSRPRSKVVQLGCRALVSDDGDEVLPLLDSQGRLEAVLRQALSTHQHVKITWVRFTRRDGHDVVLPTKRSTASLAANNDVRELNSSDLTDSQSPRALPAQLLSPLVDLHCDSASIFNNDFSQERLLGNKAPGT